MYGFISGCYDVYAKLCLRTVPGTHCDGFIWFERYLSFLIIPFGLVNVLANTLMGGLGPLDMLGGGLVGIMTSLTIVYAKRHD